MEHKLPDIKRPRDGEDGVASPEVELKIRKLKTRIQEVGLALNASKIQLMTNADGGKILINDEWRL